MSTQPPAPHDNQTASTESTDSAYSDAQSRAPHSQGGGPLLDRMSLTILGCFAVLSVLTVLVMHSSYRRNMEMMLGTAAYEKKDYSAAIPHLGQTVIYNPHDTGAWVSLGHSYYETGETSKALQRFLSVTRIEPSVHLDDWIGLCYVELGEDSLAQISLAKALHDNAHNAIASYAMGRLLLKEQRPLAAAPYFQAAARDERWDKAAAPYRKQMAAMVLDAPTSMPQTITIRPAPTPAPPKPTPAAVAATPAVTPVPAALPAASPRPTPPTMPTPIPTPPAVTPPAAQGAAAAAAAKPSPTATPR